MLEAELDGNTGSPPRMRGKLIDFRIFLAFDGITPADAGKTCNAMEFAECA